MGGIPAQPIPLLREGRVQVPGDLRRLIQRLPGLDQPRSAVFRHPVGLGLQGMKIPQAALQLPGELRHPSNALLQVRHGLVQIPVRPVQLILQKIRHGLRHRGHELVVDPLLEGGHTAAGDLGGHGVFLFIGIVRDPGLVDLRGKDAGQIRAEGLGDDDGGIVVPCLHALHRRVLVGKDPAQLVVVPQLVHHRRPGVQMTHPLIVGPPVQIHHRDTDVAGVGVGVQIGVDVEPRV